MLVPATMKLLGDVNWWLPRWLDRLLPELDPASAEESVEAAVGHPMLTAQGRQ
jgi:RND superfamily putative drug exporter